MQSHLSLTREDKLHYASEFAALRANGEKWVGKLLVMVRTPAPDHRLKMGVVCGRKFHIRAVRRNRMRRLVWETVRRIKPAIQSEDHVIFIPRNRMLMASQPEVQRDLCGLLSRAGLLKKDGITG